MMLHAESSTKPITCFNVGGYKVETKSVPKSSSSTTPNPPLFVVYPTEKGTYPVILFLHGFSIPNTSYSDLFEFIASHGYIIVAPGQTLLGFLTGMCVFSAVGDVDDAAETANWINNNQGENLKLVLPHDVTPDLENVALAGHSKGGKAAFALALGHATTSLIQGLGDDGFCGCFPPAAPWGCNHPFFFNECKPPTCYFVAKDFGHMDMLNNWMARLSGMFVCKSGKGSYADMRRACGGIFVAFLKNYMFNDAEDLTAIIKSSVTELYPRFLDELTLGGLDLFIS
ncbi:hypothetical protein E3N88_42738 [Mikania micrantha]|uniref:Uncharacterized protein n=1 Tax=Mikania micrantha TaxID=192012 RepID=A0A5N6LH12_9ASTR|nr:hypothetical protein E3N88_42738 [Mikania micrantha]